MKISQTMTKALLTAGAVLGLALGTQLNTQQVSAASGVATVYYVKGYGIALWNSPDANKKPIAGRKLMDGTSWKFSQTKVVNGVTWYKVGTNQWVSGTYFKTSAPVKNVSGVLHINYVPGYSVLLRQAPNGKATSPAKYLKHGTNWKYTGTSVVSGKTWYRVGTNQWLDGKYAAMGYAKTNKQIAAAYLQGKAFSFMPVLYNGIPVDKAMNNPKTPQNLVHDGYQYGYFKNGNTVRMTGLGNYVGVSSRSYSLDNHYLTIWGNKIPYSVNGGRVNFGTWKISWGSATVTMKMQISSNSAADRESIDSKPIQD